MNSGDDKNNPIPEEILGQDKFIEQHGYEYLFIAFSRSSYGKGEKGWKWRQLVSMALQPPEERAYMYNRLLSLLLDFGNYEKYFVFKTKYGLYHVPNLLADLNKLKIVYLKYFEIYKNIMDRIHFDYPQKEQVGRIQGKINWAKTIRSSTKFPITFVTSSPQKFFETPENILLILCAHWLLQESNRLLQEKFEEPLTVSNKKILYDISEKSKSILEYFPFYKVIVASKQFWNFNYDSNDSKLKKIELETKKRIEDGKIKNMNYLKLLQWIEEFRNLRINNIDNKKPTRHIMDSLKNVDTVYEAWIFMEFAAYLRDRNVLTNFELGDYPKCEFTHNGIIVTFWYGKAFRPGDKIVWAKKHEPDFIAMIGDNVIGVFDAKNYAGSTGLGDTHNVMLAYMNNFDTSFGALIYPNYPDDWDDLTQNEKIEKISLILNDKFPGASKGEKKAIRKKILPLSWNDLPEEYKEHIPRRAYEEIIQSKSEKKPRFHFNQTLAFLRMSAVDSEFSIDTKKKTLDFIYNAIVKSIPMTITQK